MKRTHAYLFLAVGTLALLLAVTMFVPAQAQGPPWGAGGTTIAYAKYLEIGDPALPIPVPSGGFTTIGSIGLLPGNYVVTASLYLTNGSVSDGIAACTVQIGGRNAQARDSLPGLKAVSQALTVAATLSGAGVAELKCMDASAGALSVQTFNLNVIRVGSLVFP